jgi:EAL domain-containing protein (putative c-di-GMP-specific phosphodiesterase class I)
LVGDLGMVHQTLRAARRLGVRVAIDDAGAGLGAIGHLSDLEVDLMRIDPLSVVVLDGPGGDRALVEHVIGLAKALGIVTICTGVARPAHVELLTSLGCDLAQGEFIAPASSARALSDMLAVSDATRGTVTIRLTTSAPGR